MTGCIDPISGNLVRFQPIACGQNNGLHWGFSWTQGAMDQYHTAGQRLMYTPWVSFCAFLILSHVLQLDIRVVTAVCLHYSSPHGFYFHFQKKQNQISVEVLLSYSTKGKDLQCVYQSVESRHFQRQCSNDAEPSICRTTNFFSFKFHQESNRALFVWFVLLEGGCHCHVPIFSLLALDLCRVNKTKQDASSQHIITLYLSLAE